MTSIPVQICKYIDNAILIVRCTETPTSDRFPWTTITETLTLPEAGVSG